MLYPRSVEEVPGPARIIFDLQEIRPAFEKRTAWMMDYEASLTEVMELLPAYISEAVCVQDGLNAYVERIVEDHDHFQAKRDGLIYAAAARMVGEFMIDQYRQLGLFKYNGICHYVFDYWIDPQSAVFKKVLFEDLYC